MPVLWRSLLRNYLQVFFLCTAGFISILLVTRVQEIAKLAALNSELKLIILFTLCQIPYILPIAIPISGLISAMLLLQRLSSTHELTALRASGLGVKQISAPLLMAAFVLSLSNFLVVSELTPRCRLYSRELFHNVTAVNPLFLMKKSKLLKLQDSYVDMNMTKLGREAKDIIFVVKNQSNDRLSLMTAKKFLIEDNLLTGKHVALISHMDSKNPDLFDHLILENQETMSTSASSLSHLMQKPNWKMGFEHLPMRNILRAAFTDNTIKPKTIKRARFEFYRRLYFPLITYAFTLMGISLGMQIGREKRKKGIYIAIGLAAFTFICSIAAKSLQLFPLKSAFFYFCPLPIIIFFSFWFQKRIAEGVEG